jgi:hypothetical protein
VKGNKRIRLFMGLDKESADGKLEILEKKGERG